MALDLIASGQIGVESMITHRLPFADVVQAYELARSRDDGVIKIIIHMPA
jgi:threonine dehydrogenase-like Zn-dependent dehydrogenase